MVGLRGVQALDRSQERPWRALSPVGGFTLSPSMGTPSKAGAQAEDMAVAIHLKLSFLETTKL